METLHVGGLTLLHANRRDVSADFAGGRDYGHGDGAVARRVRDPEIDCRRDPDVFLSVRGQHARFCARSVRGLRGKDRARLRTGIFEVGLCGRDLVRDHQGGDSRFFGLRAKDELREAGYHGHDFLGRVRPHVRHQEERGTVCLDMFWRVSASHIFV